MQKDEKRQIYEMVSSTVSRLSANCRIKGIFFPDVLLTCFQPTRRSPLKKRQTPRLKSLKKHPLAPRCLMMRPRKVKSGRADSNRRRPAWEANSAFSYLSANKRLMISYQRLSELSLNWILTGPELFWKYFCPKIIPKYLPNRESRAFGRLPFDYSQLHV